MELHLQFEKLKSAEEILIPQKMKIRERLLQRLPEISKRSEKIAERMGRCLSLLFNLTEPLTVSEKMFHEGLQGYKQTIKNLQSRIKNVDLSETNSFLLHNNYEEFGSYQLKKVKDELESLFSGIVALKKQCAKFEREFESLSNNKK